MGRPTTVNAIIRYRPTDRDIRVYIDHLKAYHGEMPDIWADFEFVDNDSGELGNIIDNKDDDELPSLVSGVPSLRHDNHRCPSTTDNVLETSNSQSTTIR